MGAGHEENAEMVAVIGATIAAELFGGEAAVGKTFRIEKVPFVVIGVLKEKGQDLSGRDQDDVILIPLSTAKIRVLGRSKANPDSVHYVVAKVYSAEAMNQASREIREVLRARHRILLHQEDDFRIQNMAQIAETRAAAYRQFTLLVGLLAAVSLVVGGVGVMNIMLVSIVERRREIGIRMAMGARRRDIRQQFLVEALAICAIGGIIGLIVGSFTAISLTQLAGWPAILRVDIAVIALACAIGSGLVFGIFPAIRAARLDPAVAVRSE